MIVVDAPAVTCCGVPVGRLLSLTSITLARVDHHTSIYVVGSKQASVGQLCSKNSTKSILF